MDGKERNEGLKREDRQARRGMLISLVYSGGSGTIVDRIEWKR
jgi:hypothetical protein